MKVLIIEDEKPAAQKLIRLLIEVDKHIEVVGVLESIEETVNWIVVNPSPELIFMDIQLDDGICFDIFESVNLKTPVIFTTAYDEYAIRAFKVNSIDYLLKPIRKEMLGAALSKYKELFKQDQTFQGTEIIKNLFPKQYKERFFIKVGIKYKSILTNDINCFYIKGRNAFLFTREGKNYDVDYSLDKLEDLLNPQEFFRANRNFLININAIKDIVSYSSSRIKLVIEHWNDEEIIVSRERVTAFKMWMDR
jgi:DNA-binding LytR/AlgR family response regulator